MSPVNPEMITLARESREITQSNLATIISVSQGKLSKIESGVLGVSDEMLHRLSDTLNYPSQFFSQVDPIYGPGIGELYHRKRQSTSKKLMQRLYAQINIRRIHVDRLLRGAEIAECKIHSHDIDEYEGRADEIARIVRAEWLLPRGPIDNVTEAIEEAGGIVLRCDFGTRLLDGVSRWVPGLPPLFFINKDLPPDRWRFTLCHELGHLVMHRGPNPDMEMQANRFAAELLMPKDQIRPMLTDISLPRLADLKRHWKVSMSALLKRSEDLGRITLRQARYLWMQMASAGYKASEPVELDVPAEKPTTLRELLDIHLQELNYSVSELCYLLALNENEFQSLYLQASPSPQRPGLSIVR